MVRKKTSKDNFNDRDVFKFLKKSYDEAFLLLVSSRDYLTTKGKKDKMLLNSQQQLIFTLASSTITTQLTSVMSWLLLCRAIEEGEVTIKQLKSENFSMPEFNLGVSESDSCFAELGRPIRTLLEKSCNLYNRMKRMESSVREHFMDMA